MEGWELRLQSRGADRYVSGAFLAFWLCGWAVGESLVLFLLIKGAWALLTGTPPEPGRAPLDAGPALMTGLFLLVWLTLWTVGGIAAAMEMLRLLWGEDRIRVASGRLTVTWIRGPFRRTRHFERDAIRQISLVGRRGRLMLQTARQHVELSGLGTRPERDEAAATLRTELGVPDTAAASGLPGEWEEIITPEGERALVPNLATRRTQARIASMVTLLFAAVTFAVARQVVHRLDLIVPAFLLLAFTVALVFGAMWLARGRWEWRIGSGRLTLRKRYGTTLKDVFEARRLLLDVNHDSDGDAWYELHALADATPTRPAAITIRTANPRDRRRIARTMDDGTAVRALAAWLSRASGLELDDHTTPQNRQIQLAELRTALENAGPFGKWAGKLVDYLADKQNRAG